MLRKGLGIDIGSTQISICALEGGLLLRREGRVAFTERGMYVSNAILSDWLDFGE